MHWGGAMGYGMGGFMLLWSVVLIALIVLAVVLVARTMRGNATQSPSASGETAEDILKKRYARGELDDAQYQRMIAQLRA